jgi:23S rRNA (adenine2503-C2)-methyltransferase
MELVSNIQSVDGSVKSLWDISPGISVESVRFRLDDHMHICVSSQAGCDLACRFCETGKQKNMHDLSAVEILTQVTGSITEGGDAVGKKFAVVQFAGMGEPLLNLDAVAQAARLLLEGNYSNEVTITTSGIVPKIKELVYLPLSRLNVSLHATTNETRSKIVPVNRKYPIEQLVQAVEDYQDRSGTPVIFNYLLFDGINDTEQDLERLAQLLKNDRFSVRLKAWNPIQGSGLLISPRNRFDYFRSALKQQGFDVLLCESMGADVGGGCGQLRSLERQLPPKRIIAMRSSLDAL